MRCPLCHADLPADGRCTNMVRNTTHDWVETKEFTKPMPDPSLPPTMQPVYPKLVCRACGVESFEDVRRQRIHFKCTPPKVQCEFGKPPIEVGLTHSSHPPPATERNT